MARSSLWMRWFKVFNFYRTWNLLLLGLSFYISRIFSKAYHWGLPYHVSFEPTTACNLGCPECPSGLKQFTRATGKLKVEHHADWLKSMASHLVYVTYYFQGEPFLNPQFLSLIVEAKKYRVFTATSTNAHYLTDEKARETVESGLDRLIISIDGTTHEVYQQHRVGGQLNKVLEGARKIVYWKKKLKSRTPFIFFQFLVVKPNEHQLEEVKKLGKEIGVDQVRFKTAQVYDYTNDPHQLIPSIGKYSRYKKDASGNMQVKSGLHNRCWKLWHANVITWDGLVVPCCFDKDATHRLGNLQTESFKEIWNSKPYYDFRNQLITGRKNIDICANCSEGLKVWEQ